MQLILMGNPIYQKRHRTTKWGIYDPSHKDKIITKKCMVEWLDALSREERYSLQHADFFYVILKFYLPIPKSLPIRKRNKRLWNEWCPEKPDFDNLAKYYSDCATGIIWKDDKQVSHAIIRKYYSMTPRTEMIFQVRKYVPDDDTAMEILANFSPDEWAELQNRFDAVQVLIDNSERQQAIARFMSYMGDLWSKRLGKIAKEHPEYYKTTPEVK